MGRREAGVRPPGPDVRYPDVLAGDCGERDRGAQDLAPSFPERPVDLYHRRSAFFSALKRLLRSVNRKKTVIITTARAIRPAARYRSQAGARSAPRGTRTP